MLGYNQKNTATLSSLYLFLKAVKPLFLSFLPLPSHLCQVIRGGFQPSLSSHTVAVDGVVRDLKQRSRVCIEMG